MDQIPMDIEDNAEAIRLTEAMDELIKKAEVLLSAFISKMETYKDTPCMRWFESNRHL